MAIALIESVLYAGMRIKQRYAETSVGVVGYDS